MPTVDGETPAPPPVVVAHGSVLATVGTDIVRIARVAESLSRFGERYTTRIFTDQERRYCEARPVATRAACYAARFAAKEAVIKALGMDNAIFTDIEIVRSASGAVGVELHGAPAAQARHRGLAELALSMSHEDEYAIATVTGVGIPEEGPFMHVSSVDTVGCRLPLLERGQAFTRIRAIFDHESEQQGRVRNLTRITAHSPAVWEATTKALSLYARLRRIDSGLVDLLCLYTSLLNGCRYCVDDAAGEALTSGWTPEELLMLGDSHLTAYPPPVAAALRFAAALTADPHSVDDPIVTDLRQHFDNEAILEISCVVSMKNFWNRLATGLRIPPEGKCGDPELLERLMALPRQRLWEARADD
ncbi:holo-ACP synthase [Streptosporangium sp. NPDC006013]|uniref:holo-ACP synthase n=1 Tax=Streptosporangium sp. NPDC006013 TaxID=3155596 RepID=UPI0033BD36D7